MSAPEIIYPPTVGGGTPVGGTGTTNYIPRWNPGPSTLGDSGLIDDGSVIYTTARNAAFGSTSSAGYRARVLAAAGTGSAFGVRIDAGTNSTDYALRIANQATTSDYFVVRGDGHVGAGTASPWSKLSAVTANGADTVSVGFSFDSANNYRSGISTSWSSASASGNLMGFLVSNATLTGFTRVMTLNGAGQAAIGTSSFTSGCSLTVAQSIDASQNAQGLKLPATPGNADTQTLDCYQETTLNSGFTTSGITSTGTFTVTARATRIGRGIAITIRVAPSSGASLTFASGWTITLTGVPQMPSEGSLAVATSDTAVGRGSVLISDAATPILYGGTVGAYALAANVPLTVSGFIA
jgi:hypothetical protein